MFVTALCLNIPVELELQPIHICTKVLKKPRKKKKNAERLPDTHHKKHAPYTKGNSCRVYRLQGLREPPH